MLEHNAARYMEGQSCSVYGRASHSVYGGAKPLGLWRSKATWLMEGHCPSMAYGWTEWLCHKATRPMEGQSRSVYGELQRHCLHLCLLPITVDNDFQFIISFI